MDNLKKLEASCYMIAGCKHHRTHFRLRFASNRTFPKALLITVHSGIDLRWE